jgi:hypothetical protein
LIQIKFDLSQICDASRIVDQSKAMMTLSRPVEGGPQQSVPRRHAATERAAAGERIQVSLWRSQMSALARRVVHEVTEAMEPDVLIHLRFNPSGDVVTVGEQPAHLSPHAWYTLLCEGAYNHYRTFAGGRGFFRIPRGTFDAILAKA